MPAPGSATLPTLQVLGFGVSNKRLEQAVRELQLPVTARPRRRGGGRGHHAAQLLQAEGAGSARGGGARLADLRAQVEHAVQVESALTSIFALEVDPSDAALREVEEAIGLVNEQAKPVELSPQNAYIRRLQHQMAERANLVSHSRGREPYRRVRLYPDSQATGGRRR